MIVRVIRIRLTRDISKAFQGGDEHHAGMTDECEVVLIDRYGRRFVLGPEDYESIPNTREVYLERMPKGAGKEWRE